MKVNNKESQELIKIIKELKDQIKDLKEYIKKEIVNKKKDPRTLNIDWIDWEELEKLNDE
jgi:hypothetical protein